ncbi:MAG TPA: hypothetical protein VJN93_18475 [Candidatus Acidoferrum sp.]|nr:hypothetical protein [Candidatus Acidoferrum sp.]
MKDTPALSGDVEIAAKPPQSFAASPVEIFAQARAREESLSKLLMAFISSGLFFMLFPGTFLGVWNLLQISGRESVGLISPAWLQAHGHAQVFGWVGSFILGIGFYSIPKLRGGAGKFFVAAWASWGIWTSGVAIRWIVNVYLWQWRVLLPLSASLELIAFAIFFRGVSSHRPSERGKKLEPWIWVVASACIGLCLVLLTNLVGCVSVVLRGSTPAFPHLFDQRYLALVAWGFLVPFVWGFSAKWMTVFLGLKPVRTNLLVLALVLNIFGLICVFSGFVFTGSWFFLAGGVLAAAAIRIFEPAVHEPKTRGVHSSFPFFVRLSYVWLLVAAGLGVAASRLDTSGGFWGASRHALTVGFISTMILCVGQRVLPAFAGMRLLWSTKLMFGALAIVTLGCTLRVSCEILAYQEYANWAWSVLPSSALLELGGLTLFAVNILGTFVLEPSHAYKQPMVTTIAAPARRT